MKVRVVVDDGKTKLVQTGEAQIHNYSNALSSLLQRAEERYGLATAEMEALMQLGSMATESPTRSSCQQLKILMNGLKDSELILSSQQLTNIAIEALLMAHENVRYAVVISRPGKPIQTMAYYGR